MNTPTIEFDPLARSNAERLIALAIDEDLGPERRDLTAEATIPANGRGSARFVARNAGVVAGLPVLEMVAEAFGLRSWYRSLTRDGATVESGEPTAEVFGPFRAMLMMERTALNFVQRLSGIASLTAKFVAEIEGTKGVILDTRKTTPGWRALEKYAVRCGGGTNHRFGLYDAVLIKDNHLAWLADQPDPIETAVRAARRAVPEGVTVEIEVDTLEQFNLALRADPDIILVDNLGAEALREAVRRRDATAPRILIEASGGIHLGNVGELARAGVDRLSIGALTHSAPALDIGLDFDHAIPS